MSNMPRFDAAKAFSDFLAFHVRALFCLTLAFAALFPLLNDFFIELLSFGQTTLNRTRASYWLSIIATGTFLMFFVVIMAHIFRVAVEYIRRKVRNLFLAMTVLVPVFIAEVSALAAIPYFVFSQVPILSDGLGGGALPPAVRRCLLDELVHRNGIALGQPARPECPQLLQDTRRDLNVKVKP